MSFRSFVSLALLTVALPIGAQTVSDRQKSDANRLIDAALSDSSAYSRLATLTDRFGPRLSGSKSLEDGHRLGPRPDEGRRAGERPRRTGDGAALGARRRVRDARVAARGATAHARPREERRHAGRRNHRAGTRREELRRSHAHAPPRRRARSCCSTMPFRTEQIRWTDIANAVVYRGGAPAAAAKVGAVGALIRSVASFSIQNPHTGATRYDATLAKIPTAALSVEDAEMLHRMQDRGEQDRRHAEDGGAERCPTRRRETSSPNSRLRESRRGRGARRPHRFVGCRARARWTTAAAASPRGRPCV